jgi:ribosomal protein S18 acetylase RimI-like enzyme
VIHYRSFRNADPPALARLWNQGLTGRGAALLRGPSALEACLFAKPYFDPEGLILAVADGEPVGFAHAGFGPAADGSALDPVLGVLCALAVSPGHRRQGIGAELLRRTEDYLRRRGARQLRAGPLRPNNPFTFGLYGGSESAGFLDSDALARPFLEKHGYHTDAGVTVLHHRLGQATAADGRFADYRRLYEVQPRSLPRQSWWQECVRGPIDPAEFRLVDRARGTVAAAAVLWEMDTYRPRWDEHAVGVLDLTVLPEQRRRGLGKFLLAQILRYLREQFFTLVEVQVAEGNAAGLGLVRQLGFGPVDAGRGYVRTAEPGEAR